MAAGRTALVTGAGRGIGAATAMRLSQQGYRVVLTARSADQLAATATTCPGPTLTVAADIADPGTPDLVFGETERHFGPVDVLVLNAGGATSNPIARIDDDEWRQQLELNLTAPFRCLRRAVPGMRDRRFGRIVAVASVAGKHGDPYIAAYTAAKHGLLGLVRSAAAELAAAGITVNAVCPGYVDTLMTDQSVANIMARTGKTAAEARGVLSGRQPIGRLISVEEVVTAIMLCVDNAGITGQGINVDGGAVQS